MRNLLNNKSIYVSRNAGEIRLIITTILSWLIYCISDDLYGMTRFVTWDTSDRGGSSTLYKS